MAVNTHSKLKIGDMVTHTGKRGFWSIDKEYKGIGLVISGLYKKTDRQYVHDIWFPNIGKTQQVGAHALEKLNDKIRVE